MLNDLLDKRNTRLVLESLVARNIFTVKTEGGHYRYHTLFRDYLLRNADSARSDLLQARAADYPQTAYGILTGHFSERKRRGFVRNIEGLIDEHKEA